jgi:hypothetical protein
MSDNNIKLIGNHKGIEIKFTIDNILNNEKMVSFRRGSGFFLVSIHRYAQKNSRNNSNSRHNRIVFSN